MCAVAFAAMLWQVRGGLMERFQRFGLLRVGGSGCYGLLWLLVDVLSRASSTSTAGEAWPGDSPGQRLALASCRVFADE